MASDPRLDLAQLAQSGATDGQAPLWSDTAGEYVPGAVGGAGSSLGWFNVKDPAYGAVGDNTADDTTAINAAIAALNAAGRGVLYFPAGSYKTTSDLTTITAQATILGDGHANGSGTTGASLIYRTSTTGVVFTISQHACIIERIGFVNPTTTTQTAGSAIRVTAGDQMRLNYVSVYGFYDCINIEDGGLWEATGLWLVGPVRYGLYLRHIDSPDGGDWSLSKSWIYAKDRNAAAGIRYESGGGGRISDVKINDYGGTGRFSVGIDATFATTTINLAVLGSSFEGLNGPALKGRVTSGAGFSAVQFIGCEVGTYTSITWAAVDIDGWDDITIVGNNFIARNGGSTQAAVKLANASRGAVGLNVNEGFTAEYALTSCTGITTISAGVPTSRLVSAGTGLTGGGDLSADRTLAIDTSAEAERVQDLVGAMFTDGTNITHVYDDTLGTLTVSATGGGGNRLVPMTTTIGGGDPQLVFTENGELLMVEVPA
jgi:hypothetical protein